MKRSMASRLAAVGTLVIALVLLGGNGRSARRPGIEQALDAGTYEILTPSVVRTPEGDLHVRIERAGAPLEVLLTPYSVRSDAFQLLRVDSDGVMATLPAPPPATFRGETVGGPPAEVAASYVNGQLRALFLFENGERWALEPARDLDPAAALTAHVWYPETGVIPFPGVCEARSVPEGVLPPSGAPAGTGCTRACEIAMEMDYPRFQQLGASVQAATQEADQLINAVVLIYAHDVLITYRLTSLLIETTLLEDRYAGATSDALLGQFQQYWNANLPAVSRDITHLLTGRNRGSTIGTAYIGTICVTGWNYGWAESDFPTFAYRVGVSAHELGHNWSALHCDGQTECRLMCSSIGGCSGDITRFEPPAVEAITAYRDQAACLDLGDGAALPVAPTVHPESVGTLVGESVRVDVLANDFDGNCDAITLHAYDAVSQEGGAVTLSPGTGPGGRDELVYAPPHGFLGSDRFDYTVEDATGRSAAGHTLVTVTDLRARDYPEGAVSGLRASYYPLPVFDLTVVPDFRVLKSFRTELVSTIYIPLTPGEIGGSGRTDRVGAVFTGTLDLSIPDTYTFFVESDDGALLYVDGHLVVDNNGTHAFIEASGEAALAAGPHAVRLEYFDAAYAGGVILRIQGGGLTKQIVPPGQWASPGVVAAYYDLTGIRLPNFDRLVPFYSEILSDLRFGPTEGPILGSGRSDQVAIVFEGFLTVNTPGLYTFYTVSDDGSALYIGNNVVVDNDGEHGPRERVGFVGLEAGTHAFRVEYFDRVLGAGLDLQIQGPSLVRQSIPSVAYSHTNTFREKTAFAGSGGGQGLAWGDMDGDGDEDLYLSSSGPERLYRNEGAGVFTNVTPTALTAPTFPLGAAWGDADGDGDLDLCVASDAGINALYRNDGGSLIGTTPAALALAGTVREVSWVDVNGDGRLDLFLAVPQGGGNRLLRNEGSLRFVNIASAPVTGSADTQGAAWGDMDGDGDLDLYVVNDGTSRLFRNDGGALNEVTAGPLAHSGPGRAAAWGDYDYDGDQDLCLVSLSTGGGACALFRNDGASFHDVSAAAGVNVTGNFRGVSWVDLDNDGDLDLYLVDGADGSPNPEGAPSRLLRNTGSGTFESAAFLGADAMGYGRAVGAADADGDGDLDLALVFEGTTARVLDNAVITGNHWLALVLHGTNSNPNGIGARVAVEAGGVTRTRVVGIGAGGTGHNSLVSLFGLGKQTSVEQVRIVWPSGAVQTLNGVIADRRLEVTEMADATGFVPQTIVVDGTNDFNPGNLLDDDRGDAEIANVCAGDPQPESPLDLGRIFVTNDAHNLYFGLENDRDCFCENNLGLAIDVNTAGGGTTDPFLRKIAWDNLAHKPDFCLYDVVPDGCNPDNYEVLFKWTGAWSELVKGSNSLGISDGLFTEGAIPLATLGVGAGDTLHLEFWLTQEGATKGPLDAACSDGVQLSTLGGTNYNVSQPVQMTCAFPYVVLSAPVPVELALFTAERRGEAGVLHWAVVGEPEEHAGFQVYRETPGEGRRRLTEELLRGKQEYTFTDAGAPAAGADYWLAEIARSGATTWHGPAHLEPAVIAQAFTLAPGRPNPFAEATTLRVTAPGDQVLRVRVFDLSGRQVAVLFEGPAPRGENEVVWNGRNTSGRLAPAGIYFVTAESAGARRAQRVVKLR